MSEEAEEDKSKPAPSPSHHVEEEEDEEVEKKCEEDDEVLLNKSTESFKCLQQIEISCSSLLRHPLYHFPPLIDPGLDEAYNYVEPPLIIDDTGCDLYRKLCKDMNIVPLSAVLKALPTNTLDLKYYGLTEKQIRAIMAALKPNKHVKFLSLVDNWLSVESVRCLSEMMEQNNTIRFLNLRECRIKSEGAYYLNAGIEASTMLTRLDLSFNSLGDEGIMMLEDAFLENTTIEKLNLSHNNLGEEAAKVLARIFTINNFVEHLDLSWNNFYSGPGNKVLFAALGNSRSIKVLDLAWNGLGTRESVLPISKYMRKSEVLEHINFSNNNLTGDSLRLIRFGMLKSKALVGINLSYNPITPEEALFVLRVFISKPNTLIESLDMSTIFVKKEFVPVWKLVTGNGKGVLIAGILSNYKIYGPDTMKLVFARAKFLAMKAKKKKAQKDFGHFILSLPEEPMVKQEFQDFLKKFKMKKVDKDKDLVEEIMNKFPAKKGKIDVAIMKDKYMKYYPDTELTPPKKKKEKKGKKGKKTPPAEAQPAAEGEAQPPMEGDAQPLVEGEAQPPVEGQGQPPVEREGQPPAELHAHIEEAPAEAAPEGQAHPEAPPVEHLQTDEHPPNEGEGQTAEP